MEPSKRDNLDAPNNQHNCPMTANITLVSGLRNWIAENRERLESVFVSISDRLPDREDNDQNEGCIVLTKGHILISFTAWERHPVPLELLVYNTHMDKTVVMKDFFVKDPSYVAHESNSIANLLITGYYDDMIPDSNILSS